jgi:uncharacterized protein
MRALAIFAIVTGATPVLAMDGVTGPIITGTRLNVSARGSVRRVPDVAVISAGVVTQSVDAKGAMGANAADMARIVSALRRAGISERDIATAQITLSPQYRYVENRAPIIMGYQASNSVTVRFRDVSKAGAILDSLVAAGANQINGPALILDKPDAAFDEARTEAIRIARGRADLYAKAAGMIVKRIVVISESSEAGSPMPVGSQRAMAAQMEAKSSEIIAGEQDIGVTVAVTFELG